MAWYTGTNCTDLSRSSKIVYRRSTCRLLSLNIRLMKFREVFCFRFSIKSLKFLWKTGCGDISKVSSVWGLKYFRVPVSITLKLSKPASSSLALIQILSAGSIFSFSFNLFLSFIISMALSMPLFTWSLQRFMS